MRILRLALLYAVVTPIALALLALLFALEYAHGKLSGVMDWMADRANELS